MGFTYASALVGDVWAVLNPVSIVARRVAPFLHRVASSRPPFTLPKRAGVWPAVCLFFVFTWAEIVWPENAVPAKLAGAIVLYCFVTWAAMAAVGIEPWLERGDPFARFIRADVAACAD